MSVSLLQEEKDVFEPIPAARPPILVLGMHRSGTTLLTAVLRKLGLITGWSLNNEESAFFHRLNLKIERWTGGRWDAPEPIAQAAADRVLCARLVRRVREELMSSPIMLYVGLRRYLRYRSWERVDRPWGWKDPRNTFTFDVWRHLFPGARLIHIFRCGVDVAASVRAREVGSRVQALSQYASRRCRTLEGAFGLWREYVAKALSLVPDGGEEGILHVRYEDFLASPGQVVERLLRFCELHPHPRRVAKVVADVIPERAFSFRRDPELRAFYEEVRRDPYMVRLGYGDLV